MFLAFQISDIIRIPFGYVLDLLYQLTTNYGVALIIFAVALKLIMFPMTAKSKKSTMKMSRLTPRVQALQKKYENDQQKQREAIQQVQKEEVMVTLMLWKKGKKSFSKKELTPVKSIKVSDDKKSVEIVMADKTVKKVTF